MAGRVVRGSDRVGGLEPRELGLVVGLRGRSADRCRRSGRGAGRRRRSGWRGGRGCPRRAKHGDGFDDASAVASGKSLDRCPLRVGEPSQRVLGVRLDRDLELRSASLGGVALCDACRDALCLGLLRVERGLHLSQAITFSPTPSARSAAGHRKRNARQRETGGRTHGRTVRTGVRRPRVGPRKYASAPPPRAPRSIDSSRRVEMSFVLLELLRLVVAVARHVVADAARQTAAARTLRAVLATTAILRGREDEALIAVVVHLIHLPSLSPSRCGSGPPAPRCARHARRRRRNRCRRSSRFRGPSAPPPCRGVARRRARLPTAQALPSRRAVSPSRWFRRCQSSLPFLAGIASSAALSPSRVDRGDIVPTHARSSLSGLTASCTCQNGAGGIAVIGSSTSPLDFANSRSVGRRIRSRSVIGHLPRHDSTKLPAQHIVPVEVEQDERAERADLGVTRGTRVTRGPRGPRGGINLAARVRQPRIQRRPRPGVGPIRRAHRRRRDLAGEPDQHSARHQRLVQADPESILRRHCVERQDFERAPPLAAVRCD